MKEFLHIIDGVQYKILESSFKNGEKIPAPTQEFEDTSHIETIPLPSTVTLVRNLLMVNIVDSGLMGGRNTSKLLNPDAPPITLSNIEMHVRYDVLDTDCNEKITHTASCNDIGYNLFTVESADGLNRIGLKLYADIVHNCAKHKRHSKNQRIKHHITITRIWVDAFAGNSVVTLYDSSNTYSRERILPYTFEIDSIPRVVNVRSSVKVLLNQGDKPNISYPVEKPDPGPTPPPPTPVEPEPTDPVEPEEPVTKPIIGLSTNVKLTEGVRVNSITWEDPDDNIINESTSVIYRGTTIVRKQGSIPTSMLDGDIIYTTTDRNKHQREPFVDRNLTHGTEYFYKIYQYSTDNIYNDGVVVSGVPTAPDFVKPVILSATSDGVSAVTLDIQSDIPDATFGIIYKENSEPSNISDGMIVTSTGKNPTIPGFTRYREYYFRVYAYIGDEQTPLSDAVKVRIGDYIVLGFKIAKGTMNPETRVTYTHDAVGMTPAGVDLNTGLFDYGSFKDIWFVKNNRPVMLKSDRTVAYELDHDNYDLKLDGTASDVGNTRFDGNAMSEIPKVYMKSWEDPDYNYCLISNVKYDSGFHDNAYVKEDGATADVMYMAMFEGSVVDTKIRSLKGLTPIPPVDSMRRELGLRNNGVGWNTWTYSRWNLINNLLILMSKSVNSQAKYGYGNHTNTKLLISGGASTRGQFTGTNIDNDYMKVFHIENYYGNASKYMAGLIGVKQDSDNKVFINIKAIPPYDTDFVATNISIPTDIDGAVLNMSSTEMGLIPKVIYNRPSYSIAYSDKITTIASTVTSLVTTCAYVGGCLTDGLGVGCFCLDLTHSNNYNKSSAITSLSCA